MSEASRSSFQIPRRWREILMWSATAACVIASPFGAVGALVSPLVFDHPGNTFNPLAWIAFLLMVGFWVVCLLAPLGAWILFRRDREPLAWATMTTPLLWAVLLAAVLQFVPG